MESIPLIADEYTDFANRLLKTDLSPFISSANCDTPNERTVVLHWDVGDIDMQLDLRLNTKEGWLYTSDRRGKTDCLRVYNLISDKDINRMLDCLREYLK